MHKAEGTLKPTPPFDFDKTLWFLGYFTPAKGEQVVTQTSVTKAVMIGGQVLAFTVSSTGTVDAPELHYDVYSEEPISDATHKQVADRIASYLSIHDDLRPFYKIGLADPHFAPAIEKLYGHHQVEFLTPFENAAWAMLTQRTPINAARKVKQTVMEKYGDKIVLDGTTYWAFPEPQKMLGADESELFAITKNEKRAQYLRAVTVAFADADEHWLRTGDYDEVYAWLRKIRGIGEWSAAFLMIRALGRMDKLKSVEERLIEAASRLYSPNKLLTKQEVEAIAERYSHYAGHWAYYVRNA